MSTLPTNLVRILFVDDDVFFAKGYLDELDKSYIPEIARTVYDAEREVNGPDIYACVILDVMMPIPEWWSDDEKEASNNVMIWPDSDVLDAQHGLKTGIILLRRYRQVFIERNLPVIVLTNRQKREIESEISMLGFPPGLIEVRHKLETPSFVLPNLVRDIIHRIRGASVLGGGPHS